MARCIDDTAKEVPAPTAAKALPNTALVERSAQLIWWDRQLGEVYHLPSDVDASFASVDEYLRANS